MIQIFGLQALYSASAIINKKLVMLTSPFVVVVARLFCVGVLLFLYEWYKNGKVPSVQKKHLFIFIYIACCGMLLRKFFYYWALSYTPVTKVSLILNCTPFCVGLLTHYWYKKRVSTKQWIALACAFFGTLPILFVNTCPELVIAGLYFTWADLALVAGVFLYSISVLMMQNLIVEHKYPSSLIYAVCSLGSGLFGTTLLYAAQYEIQIGFTGFFLSMFLLLIGINFFCGNVYYAMLKYHSATFLALTDCLGPIFVAAYSSVIFQDSFTWHYYASAISVSFALFLFYQDELKLAS